MKHRVTNNNIIVSDEISSSLESRDSHSCQPKFFIKNKINGKYRSNIYIGNFALRCLQRTRMGAGS